MKNKQHQVLTTKEKSRNKYSAEYFSRGASKQLKENMVSNFFDDSFKKFEKISGEVGNVEKDTDTKKSKLKKRKKRSWAFKVKLGAFVALSATAVIVGNKIIKKIDEVSTRIKQNTNLNGVDVGVFDKEYSQKFKNTEDKIMKMFNDDYISVIKTGVGAILGIGKENVRKLNIRKVHEQGLIPYLINQFAKVTVTYIFAKGGAMWILDMFGSFKGADYVDITLDVWKQFASQPVESFSYIGKNVTGAQLLVGHVERANEITNKLYAGDFAGNLTFSNAKFILENADNKLRGVNTSHKKSYDDLQLLSLQMESITQKNSNLDNYDVLGVGHDVLSTGGFGGATFIFNKENRDAQIKFYETYCAAMAKGFVQIGGKGWDSLVHMFDNTVDVEFLGEDRYYVDMYKVYEGDSNYFLSKSINQYIPYPDKSDDENDAEMSKNMLESLQYVDKILIDMKIYDNESFQAFEEIYKDLLRRYSENDQPNALTYKEFYWSNEKYFKFIQFVSHVVEWETYQSLQSIKTAGGFYSSLLKETIGDEEELKIRQHLRKRRLQVAKHFISYARGFISFEEALKKTNTYLSNEIGRIVDKNRLTEKMKDSFDMMEKDIYQKLDFGKIYNKIQGVVDDINKKMLKEMTNGNFIVISNETLRDNFDTLTKTSNIKKIGKGGNKDIVGKLFNEKYVGSEGIFSHENRVFGGINWGYIAVWEKYGSSGVNYAKDGDEDWKDEISLYNWWPYDENTISSIHEYCHSADDGNGAWFAWEGDVNQWKYGSGRSFSDNTWVYESKKYGERTVYKDYTWGWTPVDETRPDKIELWRSFGHRPIGKRLKKRYEEITDKGEVFTVLVWDYYKGLGNEAAYQYTEVIERKLSSNTSTGLFQSTYDDGIPKNIPDSIAIELYMKTMDKAEREKKMLLKERYNLLSDILLSLNGDTLEFIDLSK